MRMSRMLVLSAVVVLAHPALGTAQASADGPNAPWPWIDGIGYGAAGLGLGALAAWDQESTGFGPSGSQVGLLLLGGALGTWAGIELGQLAVREAERGRISHLNRAMAATGVILVGAAIGAAWSSSIIDDPGEGTRYGSDEETFAKFTLGGAAAAIVPAWWLWRDLAPATVHTAPTILPDGNVGLGLALAF